MISVSEATAIILSHTIETGAEEISIQEAPGRILKETIRADRDFPPFNRVTMDGIAVSFASWQKGVRIFTVEGIQAAGQQQKQLLNPQGCMEVMTGAMLPLGTDTVVPYESLELKDGKARIVVEKIEPGDSIHQQGVDARNNEALLMPGLKISPADVALLAAVGKKKISVAAFPKTAIISTGDELIPVELIPLPYQIRRSNSYALQAALRELGSPADQFHLPDDPELLDAEVKKILQHYSVIIFSGGVSKGKYDYIPQTLERNGIQKRFHQVSQRPGKPLWFGTSARHVVFALPGNPVSTYMCFYRYIKPWLMKSLGVETPPQQVVLAQNFSFKPALTYFLQVKVKNEMSQLKAWPDAGGGSGDFANLKDVDGFIELPAEGTDFKAGQVFRYYPFRSS
ncbi:MAG: molybdopterin molybdotransferase MoeA [Cyclobacteriaceae bacterium]|nr:molybdopterin molybdotransferase MoeA [Cyclobacteriaceae bacterium]